MFLPGMETNCFSVNEKKGLFPEDWLFFILVFWAKQLIGNSCENNIKMNIEPIRFEILFINKELILKRKIIQGYTHTNNLNDSANH